MKILDIKLKYKNLRYLAKYKYNWDETFIKLMSWLFARENKEIELCKS